MRRNMLTLPVVIYSLLLLFTIRLTIDFLSPFLKGEYTLSGDSPDILIMVIGGIYLLISIFFATLAYGVFKRKKWAYWLNLATFILALFSLPSLFINVNPVNISGNILILAAGAIVGLNKGQFINTHTPPS